MKIFFTGMIMLCALVLAAHPASDIQISSDLEKGEIQVQVLHAVSNPEVHFIREVTVSLNGDRIITQQLQKQSSSQSLDLVYRIPGLKAGDEMEVQTVCNRIGARRQKYTIPAQ